MKTRHTVIFEDARHMAAVASDSVALVVTSPPYPMIEMWDAVFTDQNPAVGRALNRGNGPAAFAAMHRVLDPIWIELHRVLKPGGITCINIGDATRTVDGQFSLYPNHAWILNRMIEIGFSALPTILWRKPTNAPNKFMGSGMLPPGAYVTLEHEYILVFRKGNKREFTAAGAKRKRHESAYFWEERNRWFSDVWTDLVGTRQGLLDKTVRKRSAAFPFELAYRLVNMFSVKGDTVLDPFLGLGTTLLAAMAAGRNSIGFEIDGTLRDIIHGGTDGFAAVANARIRRRLADHLRFIEERTAQGKSGFRHTNIHYGFPVITSQEKALLLNDLVLVEPAGGGAFEVRYADGPQQAFAGS